MAKALVQRLIAHYGTRIKVVFRHYPLRYHKRALLASQAAVAAQAQGKFWDMHDRLFDDQSKLSRTDLIDHARQLGLDVERFTKALDSAKYESRVLSDKALGQLKQLKGTPSFYINGKEAASLAFSSMKSEIDAILNAAP